MKTLNAETQRTQRNAEYLIPFPLRTSAPSASLRLSLFHLRSFVAKKK